MVELAEFEQRPDVMASRAIRKVRNKDGAERDAKIAAIADAEEKLNGTGRLVIRKSGTEPLIRVMAEGEDKKLVESMVDQICDAVRKAA